MADLYKMELDKLTAYMGDAEKDNIKKDLAISESHYICNGQRKIQSKSQNKKRERG